jgi:hypothetical protein
MSIPSPVRASTPRRTPRAKASARPTLEKLESRLVLYAVSTNVWPNPQLITISFEPDGTVLGTNAKGPIVSNLFATMDARFGSPSVWENQILKAAQTWAQQTNINFAVVPDSGAPAGSGNDEQGDPTMGDIRIGGYNFGVGNDTLAQTYMPPPIDNFSVAGDVQFNTGQTWNVGAQFDLYTVALHELGHSLGMYHSAVLGAVMYPSYTGAVKGLSADDVAGIRSIYSAGGARSPDAYGGANNSFADAADLSSQVDPTSNTALVTGLNIATAGQSEYFKVTLPQNAPAGLTVEMQSSGLSLLEPKLTVYAANQTTVLGAASASGYTGGTATVTLSAALAGQTVYIKAQGYDTTAFGTGAYALVLGCGTNPLPTVEPPSTQTAAGAVHNIGGGQAISFSPEAQVTTAQQQAGAYQEQQTVGVDAQGNYVVVWASQGTGGAANGVFAQFYNYTGNPVGGPVRVNTATTAAQWGYPSIAMDPAGAFVVTWSALGEDGSGWGVYARRYNAAGVAQGGEFRVNTTTLDDQMYSSVAMDANGDFVITWSGDNPYGSAWGGSGWGGTGWNVYAQRYNAAGVAQGGPFQVNAATPGGQEYSAVAMDAWGDFVITWSGDNPFGTGWNVYAQRYNAAGVAQGGPFQVNPTSQGNQMYSSVAMDAGGDFVITWSSQDGSGWGIYAQRYNYLGAARGGEFLVNTTTQTDQEYSTVAMDMYGNFFVTWSSHGQDSAGWNVYGQQYDADGTAVGKEFRVNTVMSGDQEFSSIGMNAYGVTVVSWLGFGPNTSPGDGLTSGAGVFAQLLYVGAGSGMAPMVGSNVCTYVPAGGHGPGCQCAMCQAALRARLGLLNVTPPPVAPALLSTLPSWAPPGAGAGIPAGRWAGPGSQADGNGAAPQQGTDGFVGWPLGQAAVNGAAAGPPASTPGVPGPLAGGPGAVQAGANFAVTGTSPGQPAPFPHEAAPALSPTAADDALSADRSATAAWEWEMGIRSL